MKRLLLLSLSLLSLAAVAATVSLDPARLGTCEIVCRGNAPAAFPAVVRGHALVVEAQSSAVVQLAYVAAGSAATNAVGAVTNGLLKATSTLGLPPLREGDLLLFTGPAAATNRVLVTYSSEKRLGPPK